MKRSQIRSRGHWKTYGLTLAVVLAGFVVAYQFVGPPVPRTFKLAAGSPTGAYYAFATRYAEILARHGIHVEVVQTSGSVENAALLADEASGVDVAFIQGGTVGRRPEGDLLGLASLYYEPLWVFQRADAKIEHLADLAGKKVAIGPEGSGTRTLALQILKANGVTDQTASLLETSGEAAEAQLLAGELDAVFMVASLQAPLVDRMLRDKRLAIFSFTRSAAYTRRFRFLSGVQLPEGMVDFDANLPRQTVDLVAPAATLAAREDFDSALIDLLLQAAEEVHGEGDYFAKRGEFPSADYLELPLSPDADRFFKYGPPFLQRYLPFWLATMVDRLKVMLLPLLVLLIPMFKLVPPTLRWKTRRKIIRWYRQLREIDLEIEADAADIDKLTAEIDTIEREVSRIAVPLGYANQLYDLRVHIALIRDRLRRKSAAP